MALLTTIRWTPNRTPNRARGRAAGLLLGGAALSLASCSGGPPPVPQNYPPLHYEYLTPLRLNVANIDVENESSQPDGDLSHRSPANPVDALERMAHDRLVAVGPSGSATFTVTEASITNGDQGVTEKLGVRLSITDASGGQSGFAEAHVSRSESSSQDDQTGAPALYELTRAAMQDMNVEFEYQVRHQLAGWLVSGDAAEAPVTATPLGGGAGGPNATGGPGAAGGPESGPMQLAPNAPPPSGASTAPASVPPSAAVPDVGAGAETPAAPSQMSPPPGFLSLPPGDQGGASQGGAPAANYPQGAYPQGAYPQGAYPEGASPAGAYPPNAASQGGYPQGDGQSLPPSSQAYPPGTSVAPTLPPGYGQPAVPVPGAAAAPGAPSSGALSPYDGY